LRVGGERVEGEAALRYGADQLMQRWSFPLVRWEDRPHIPASAHAAIRAERARFLEELDELIARFESRGVGMENGSFAVSCLVKDWAERVSLYRYY